MEVTNVSHENPTTQQFERVAKASAAVLAVLYAVGLVITNMFLGLLGAPDFSDLRPRAVLVGFAFAVYLAIPLCLIVAPLFVFDIARRYSWRRTPSILCAFGSAGALFFLLPAPF